MEQLREVLDLVKFIPCEYKTILYSPWKIERTSIQELKKILEACEEVFNYNRCLLEKNKELIPKDLYKYSNRIAEMIFNCENAEVVVKVEKVNIASGQEITVRRLEKLSEYIKNRPGSDT